MGCGERRLVGDPTHLRAALPGLLENDREGVEEDEGAPHLRVMRVMLIAPVRAMPRPVVCTGVGRCSTHHAERIGVRGGVTQDRRRVNGAEGEVDCE